MQMDRSCSIVEQYLSYLITIKGRSKNTVIKYRLDLLQFFRYVADARGEEHSDFHFATINYICSVSLDDLPQKVVQIES
jgi:site-specific recombinase XerD